MGTRAIHSVHAYLIRQTPRQYGVRQIFLLLIISEHIYLYPIVNETFITSPFQPYCDTCSTETYETIPDAKNQLTLQFS